MAVRLPNGATLQIVNTYASPKTVTIVTNANPAVVTAVAHGYSNGDFVEITSGWSKLDQRVVKVAGITTDTFTIGIDTTDTTKYPAAGGTGTVRKMTAMQQIVGVMEFAGQGGDQQFVTYEFLESDDQFQLPTTRAPQSITFKIADDTSLPHYALLAAADADRAKRGLLLTLPGGSVITYNAYVSMNLTPQVTKGQVMALSVVGSLLALPVRY